MKTAIRILIACAMTSIAGFIIGRTSGQAQPPALRADVAAGLDDVVRDVELHEVPLTDAIDVLSRTYGVPLTADWFELRYHSIPRTSLVSFVGRDVTLGEVLSGATVNSTSYKWGQLSYKVNGRQIVVTTPYDAEKSLVWRCYNVEPILLMKQTTPPVPAEPGAERVYDIGGGLFGGGGAPRTLASWVGDSVADHVAANTWGYGFSNDTAIGRILATDHELWIRHTAPVQVDVARHLNQLYENQLQRLKDRKQLIQRLQEAEKP